MPEAYKFHFCATSPYFASQFKMIWKYSFCLFVVDGNWGPWFPWQPCNVSCGLGVRFRERLCNDPPTRHGGLDCSGEDKQFRDCDNGPCPGWYKRSIL